MKLHSVSLAHLESLHSAIGSKLPPILHTYILNSALNVDNLVTALAMQDWERLDKECHRLKGSSGNIGALQLPTLCRRLQEVIPPATALNQTAQILSMIQRENSAIITDLQTFLDAL